MQTAINAVSAGIAKGLLPMQAVQAAATAFRVSPVALNQAIGIEGLKAMRAAYKAASGSPSIAAPKKARAVTVNRLANEVLRNTRG